MAILCRSKPKPYLDLFLGSFLFIFMNIYPNMPFKSYPTRMHWGLRVAVTLYCCLPKISNGTILPLNLVFLYHQNFMRVEKRVIDQFPAFNSLKTHKMLTSKPLSKLIIFYSTHDLIIFQIWRCISLGISNEISI